MASEYETVAKVIDDFAYLITLGNIRPAVATNIKSRIKAAHQREVEEMKKELDEWKSNCNFNHEDRKKKQKQIVELREENKRLRAALKPVLECKVLSALTAEVKPGRSEYCATIIQKVQHIYNDGEEKQKKGSAK